MFVVLLRFSSHRDQAARLLAAHNEWLRSGFDDGVFLLAGSIQPAAGGAILAHGVSHADLQRRVDADPFVAAGIVDAEIIAVSPAKTDPQLAFLLG